jgi:hypothetical protein
VKTFAEINSFIKTTLEATGKFEWSAAPDDIIWSTLQKSDNIASIGYKPSAEGDIKNKVHTIDITKAKYGWGTPNVDAATN